MNSTFQRPTGGVLQLGPGVLEKMLTLCQSQPDSSEGGGILLGRMILDSTDVIVDEITLPDKMDKRGRFFFNRAKASGNKRIRQAWLESSGTRNYIGEWHTHPEDWPTPSGKDLWNWATILQKARIEQDHLFFLILGLKELSAWELWKGKKEPIKLIAVNNQTP